MRGPQVLPRRAQSALALLALVVALLAPGVPHAGAYTFGPTVQQLGPEQIVFDWSTQRCNDNFTADSPARAWKDSSNQVHLTLSSNNGYSMIGPTLNTVAVNCNVVLPSHFDADPAKYDDQEWVFSTYTPDGTNVLALVHEEYHGWEHPGQCSSQGRPDKPKLLTIPIAPNYDPGCWYNAITYATSTDGGYNFTQTTPPSHLVASSPYQYVQSEGAYGYFSPSNIVRKPDGYYYAVIQAEAHGAQQVGVCEIRTKNPLKPTSWRAWDGTGFNIQFINPYTNPDPPENHVCAPVQFENIEKMVQSLTYSSYFRKYLLVGQGQLYDPSRGEWVYGFYYSTSSDLLNWSRRTLLLEIPLPWNHICGGEDSGAYPVLLNPGSSDRNFGATSQSTYLYWTRLHYDENCNISSELDLNRIPIKFVSTVTPP
jgi:hypothetical protein